VCRSRCYRATLARGLKITLILILPAVVVRGVLAQPVIALAFQHGSKFHAYQTAQTAAALQYYTPGLAFAAVDQLLIFAFYAKNDTKTPVVVGVISIVCYLVVALATLHPLSFRGLALADSAKQLSHAVVLYVLLRRWQGRIGGLRGHAHGHQPRHLRLHPRGAATPPGAPDLPTVGE